ncbi:uncharacterized protein [Drosophila virilis]|uniref:Uncharacterized protein n=1 Tax=Drosophila virilis TaxID=7244 RepID=B4M9N3_DROVI|nr:uncharacterized protein LOC6633949 [Drosophila virilis]EDW57909.1 uncharacterized protein Dvir_GJ18349 [Drosophila virilis]
MSDDRCLFCISARSFVKTTLHVDLYLVMFAIPQWMLLAMYAAKDHLLHTLICFIGTFMLLSAIQKSSALKYNWPWNWLAIGCCYELVTLGLGTLLMNTDFQQTMMLVAVALLICGFVLVLCFFIVNGYHFPNPYGLAGLAILGFIQVTVIMTVNTVFYWQHWTDLAMLVLLISVLTMMVSLVLISFHNHEILIQDDALLVAFVLYVNYVLVLMACFICYQRVDNNFASRSKSGRKAAVASPSA